MIHWSPHKNVSMYNAAIITVERLLDEIGPFYREFHIEKTPETALIAGKCNDINK
jgi:hypothetical protein